MTSEATPLRIREATRADIEAVASAHLASWRAAYRGLVPDAILDVLTEADFVTRWTRDFEALPEGTLWVATPTIEGEADVLGFAWAGRARALDLPRTWGEVHAIHLRPEHVGAGLGRALFERGIETMRALGCTEAVLWVLEGNLRARRFYERAGWAPDGTRHERTFEAGAHRALVPEVRHRARLEPRGR